MKSQHKTAAGKVINMDNLRLLHEETIAVGNMRVNARGDELGPGGVILKSRNKVMDEYYRLNTPTPIDTTPVVDDRPAQLTTPTVSAADPISPAQAAKLKGSLANSFAKK
jgi:hypothetical protein